MHKASITMKARLLLCAAAASLAFGPADAKPAPKVLYQFQGAPDGFQPAGGTLADGIYYGVTTFGGENGDGMLYKFDLSTKTETPLHSFSSSQTIQPVGDLLSLDDKVYGVTVWGGKYSVGTLYALDKTTGQVEVLHDFKGGNVKQGKFPDGAFPSGGLIPFEGKLYGVTSGGGFQNTYGIIYSFDPATGREKALYHFFNAQDHQLGLPSGTLVEHNGALFGVGTYGCGGQGGVFRFDLRIHREVTLYCFSSTDGTSPKGLTLASDGLLYGTLTGGGANGLGSIYSIRPASGAMSIVHSFTGGDDGEYPGSSLYQVGDKLYGEGVIGGQNNAGTIFEFDPATGKTKIISSFAGGAGGLAPCCDLSFADGSLYGVTGQGGVGEGEFGHGNGTIFQLRLQK